MESSIRELLLVMLLALIGVGVAGAVVLAPWHAAQAGIVVEVHPPAASVAG
ncbi:hypothetical protein [Catellatospora paridis]|uniref:hypothetical protein n=1 Tax=Catellatospora paridis TaxID=1617086 RepID=UPI0012D474CF|nr:hypothetical protein [Catellatospora paridis]